MSVRYFVDAPSRATIESVVALRGGDCAITDSTVGLAPGTTCVFVADQPLVHAAQMAEARAAGATIVTASAGGELRRHAHKTPPAHERCAPTTLEEFGQPWLYRLLEHVSATAVREIERADGLERRATLLLLHGPTGSGKSCALRVLTAHLDAQRTCRLYGVRPGEFNTEGGGGTEEVDGAPEIGTTAGEMAVALAAAAEHCRRVRTRELRPEALFLLVLEDLDDVTGGAASIVAGLSGLARLMLAQPRNLAMVATCESLYARSAAVKALTTGASTLPFAVERLAAPPLSSSQIARRLVAGLGFDSVRADEVARRSDGNAWAALHMAEFGVSAASTDVNDQRAACERLRSLVSTAAEFTSSGWTPRRTIAFVSGSARTVYESQRARRSSLFATMAGVADNLPYADDALRANLGALLPAPPAGDSPAMKRLRADIEQSSLDAAAEALDCLSRADIYDQARRESGFAGRDGQDVDKALYEALGVVAPCLALAVRARIGTPNRSFSSVPLDFKSAKARAARESAERNAALLSEVRPQLELLAARPGDGPLLLARDEAWRAANSLGRALVPRAPAFAMTTLDLVFAVGRAGLALCRRLGLDGDMACRVVAFSRFAGADAVRAEYAALVKAKPKELAPRIAESYSGGGKRKLVAEEAPAGKSKRRPALVKGQTTLPFRKTPSKHLV